MNTPVSKASSLGVIGLGTMGLGAAHSAIRRGVPTWGCDTRPEAREALAQAGGHGEQAEIMVAQHAARGIAQTLHPAQHRGRIGAAVHQVAEQVDRVAAG